jgi:hypothetical protein
MTIFPIISLNPSASPWPASPIFCIKKATKASRGLLILQQKSGAGSRLEIMGKREKRIFKLICIFYLVSIRKLPLPSRERAGVRGNENRNGLIFQAYPLPT